MPIIYLVFLLNIHRPKLIDEHEAFHIRGQIETMPVTHDMIAQEPQNDKYLSPIENALIKGNNLGLLGLRK